MSNYQYYLSLVLGLLLTSSSMIAQNNGLPTGEVDVVDEFQARLIEAERFVVSPVLPPLDTHMQTMQYNITGKALQVQYLPPKITPRRYVTAPAGPIYQGYLLAGVGLPGALYLDGAYDLSKERSPFRLGIDLFHQQGSNTRIEHQKFANSQVELSSTYYSDFGFSVDADLGYQRDVVHFYGYNDLNDSLSYAEDDVKQRFSTLYARAKLSNNQPTVADIDYSAELDFYNLQDNFAARETGFLLAGEMTKWLSERHPISVAVIIDMTSFQDTASQHLNNYFFQPSYTYHGDAFRAKIGVNLASNQDNFYLFPDIEVAVNLIENILTGFAGTKGNLYKNNLQSLSNYNPFVTSRIAVRNSASQKYYGGIKGQIMGIDYRAQASYESVNNLALFTSTQDSIPRFDVVYDTAGIVSLAAEISAPVFENFELIGAFTQRFYTLRNNDKAWHLPALTLNVGASYQMLEQKLHLRGDLFVENGVPVPTTDGSKNLNALLDLSGKATYQFSDQLGGFLQVNNILNNRRQRWEHYPTFGINALVGIQAKF